MPKFRRPLAAVIPPMIRHSVGCRVVETFPVSLIDESYFEEM